MKKVSGKIIWSVMYMNKCLVLFVEGDTEVEFYKRVLLNARQKRPQKRFDISIECKNVKGVGGFKNIALRKFIKEIKPKYGEECEFSIALCRDTDVFELSPKPPVDWVRPAPAGRSGPRGRCGRCRPGSTCRRPAGGRRRRPARAAQSGGRDRCPPRAE